jgi:membrane associated rhomboid family serine protease
MFLPIRTDSPLHSTPYVNWGLILLNVGVFIIQLGMYGGDAPRALVLDPVRPQLHQFLTYAFLHGGMMHLLSNMLFLYIFGNNLNDKLGNIGYLAFFLTGAVLAGVAHAAFEQAPVIGASGAVFAVCGGYAVLFPRAVVTVLYFFILIGVFQMPSLYLIGIYFALDLFRQFIPFLGGGGIAHLAHIGGAMAGFAVCLGLLRLHLLPRDQYDVLALIQRWNRRRQYRGVVKSGYNAFDYHKVKQEAPNPHLDRIQDMRAEISESIAHRQLPRAAELYQQLRKIDPQQVLSRQSQLDVANQLFADAQHQPAAEAYELFLTHYPRYESPEQVRLILGVIYGRYLNQPQQARQHLEQALPSLQAPRDIDLARQELTNLGWSDPDAQEVR